MAIVQGITIFQPRKIVLKSVLPPSKTLLILYFIGTIPCIGCHQWRAILLCWPGFKGVHPRIAPA
jgi:hypothetical protein